MPFTPDKPKSSFKPDNTVASSNPQNPSYMQMPKDVGYTPGGTPASQALADPAGNARNAGIGVGMATGGAMGGLTAGMEGAAGVGARIAGNAVSGAAQGAVDPNGSATGGAALGAVMGTAGEAVNGVLGLGKWLGKGMSKFTDPQAAEYLNNPDTVSQIAKELKDPSNPALQDRALGAINQSRSTLKAQGLQNSDKLNQLLTGKQVQVDPTAIEGLNPEVDEILDINRRRNAPDQSPMDAFKAMSNGDSNKGPVTVDAQDARKMKQILGEQANFAQGSITDPTQAAKNAAAGKASGMINGSLKDLDPQVGQLSTDMQNGLNLQNALRTGAKNNPISFVSTEAPDRSALLGRVENATNSGVTQLGNQIGAAKEITAPDSASGVPAFLWKLGGRGLLKASDAGQKAVQSVPGSSTDIQAILQGALTGSGNNN